MGLLGEIYSAGDSAKRKLKGLLSDPLGELGLLGARAAEDMQTFLDTGAKAYPMLDPRLKPRLDTPQGREMVVDQNVARQKFGEMAANMGMAAATVWHGSPHKFDRFDSSKIGTGEGAQAYGHGLYLAESPNVAKSYAEVLGGGKTYTLNGKPVRVANMSPQEQAAIQALTDMQSYGPTKQAYLDRMLDQGARPEAVEKISKAWDRIAAQNPQAVINKGELYKVDLPDEAIAKMLDWDLPLSQQAPEIKEAFNKLVGKDVLGRPTKTSPVSDSEMGRWAYEKLQSDLGMTKASAALREAGIPGIRYLDGGSRGAGTGTSNYVVFPGNEGLLTILERNGVAP